MKFLSFGLLVVLTACGGKSSGTPSQPSPTAPIVSAVPPSVLPGGLHFTVSNGRIDVRVDGIFTYWVGPLALADGIATGAQVDAGTLLGHHSTFPAFDFSVLRSSLQLNFINPLRYSSDTLQADGPMQYFDEPVRSAILAKVLRTGGETLPA